MYLKRTVQYFTDVCQSCVCNTELPFLSDDYNFDLKLVIFVSKPSLLFFQVDGGVEKKWARSNSLRRTFNSARHNASHQQDPAAHSDTEIGKVDTWL